MTNESIICFRDRVEAGRVLAERLHAYAREEKAIVLGLPRGGVPVAFEVALELQLLLDVLVVRKLGFPGFGELAMGAIASGGIRVLNDDVLRQVPLADKIIERVTAQELQELERREHEYRDGRTQLDLRGHIAILIDDGLATGSSMRAAVKGLRELEAAKIVVAVPVGSPETCRALKAEADEVICVHAPADFEAVGQYYQNFSQTTDDEVRQLLARATARTEETPV